MILIGKGSPITVSLPMAMSAAADGIADYLHSLFPSARVCVVARQQQRVAIGDTGTASRGAVVKAIEELIGYTPEGASLRDVRSTSIAKPIGATSPEIIRIAAMLGATLHDASEFVTMTREEATELLCLASDDLLRAAVRIACTR